VAGTEGLIQDHCNQKSPFWEEIHGMRPTMHVQVGDVCQKGQLLFEDKKNPGIKFNPLLQRVKLSRLIAGAGVFCSLSLLSFKGEMNECFFSVI